MIQRNSSDSMICLMLAFALAVNLATATALLTDAFTEEEIRDIEKFVGDVMGCANIPGLALAVIRGDATFSTGLGVANMATGHPVDKGTAFNLGSTAKALVPYILAEIMNSKENHNGRLTWNSTLREILGGGIDIEVPATWGNLTLRDILVYKSGSSAADMTIMAGLPSQVNREEIVRRLRFLQDTPDFRKSNHFSNVMYTVAGHLAERVSGTSWAELVKAMVLDKQSMNSASFAPEGMAVEESAHPYKFHSSKPRDPFMEQNSSLFNLHPFLPVGSLMASAEDITKWLRHILHNLHSKGKDSGINLFIGDAFHQWVTVPSEHKEGMLSHESDIALGYGMGWYSSMYRGLKRSKFSGRLYAYSSQIWLYPEASTAVFVSVNGPGTDRGQRALEGILYHISDITLRKPTWVDNDMACCCQNKDYDYESDDHKDETLPAELKLIKYMVPVEKYIGNYGHGLVGNLNIEPNKSGILVLKLGRNLLGELTPGVTESKLKFTVTSPLQNTEEWCSEKTIEFLLAKPHPEGVGHSELYDKVRIYVKDNLFYEFSRGKLFEDMLNVAEEEDRKVREKSESLLNNEQNEENATNRTTENEVEYSNEDNEAGDGDNDSRETNNDNIHRSHDKPDKSTPDFDDKDDLKSDWSVSMNSRNEGKHEGHQSHQFYSPEGQGDEPRREDPDDLRKVTETGQKKGDKHDHGNNSRRIHSFPIFIFIITVIRFF